MRILHLTNAVNNDGTGLTNSTVDSAIAQSHLGHTVGIACRTVDDFMAALLRDNGVRVWPIVASRPLDTSRHDIKSLRRIINGADVCHPHTVKTTALLAALSPRVFATRSIATIHNPHQRSVGIMFWCRKVVTLNDDDARRVARSSAGMRKARVIPNGTVGTLRRIPPSEVQKEDLGDWSVLYVGALAERKGLDVLMDAIDLIRQKIPDVHLTIVGNRDNNSIELSAHELGLDGNVSFIGFRDDPRGLMKGARVFVLPSRVEAFGNVLTEARTVGAAIVATTVGGIPTALSGGQAGLLVEPGNPRHLADALARVLSDPQLNADLRARAAIGLDEFSTSRMASDYIQVYEELARRRARFRRPLRRPTSTG